MLLSIKTKLKLSRKQETMMSKHAGIARFTYNWGLATWNNLYKDGLKPNKYILKKFFNNHVKPEFTWIKETGICQKITQYAYARVANLRKDTINQITTFLCKNHAKIVVEDLNVSGLLSNHKLAQVIADCSFHEFKRQLEYKAKKFGCEIIIASRWFPSSKTCSNCGHVQDMPLKERTYNCKNCGHSMDRDLNAAINLSRLAKA